MGTFRKASRAPLALAALALLAACGSPSPSESAVTGEIDDSAIRLDARVAPANARFSLTNVGANPCELVVVVTTLAADELLVVDGQVDLTALGQGNVVHSVDSAVQPGALAEWDEELPDDFSGGRVIFCNDPGDYESGRFAGLPISTE